ncbi:MAG: hypothetical protein HY813_01125 [Candidatus Portnoybacteria bacterium]|nr:hypothetical protein [Candidatus Portnoybacteria bacterium]
MQKEAKEKIKRLVERYESLSEKERNAYNEQQTKEHFIRPLFEVLGWDFEYDVWSETDVQKGRVDYAFITKELHTTEENSNKWERLKSEIEKTDKKIDEEVYKLYGLTPEEIEIVENSAK